MGIEDALADDAAGEEIELGGGGRALQRLADQGADAPVDRRGQLPDNDVERGGRIGHFQRQDPPVPGGTLRIEQMVDEALDEAAHPLLGRPREIVDGDLRGALLGLAEDPEVKLLLVAEVIIHRRQVDPGAGGDLPDGGAAEAPLGEGRPRRRDDPLAGVFPLGGRSIKRRMHG